MRVILWRPFLRGKCVINVRVILLFWFFFWGGEYKVIRALWLLPLCLATKGRTQERQRHYSNLQCRLFARKKSPKKKKKKNKKLASSWVPFRVSQRRHLSGFARDSCSHLLGLQFHRSDISGGRAPTLSRFRVNQGRGEWVTRCVTFRPSLLTGEGFLCFTFTRWKIPLRSSHYQEKPRVLMKENISYRVFPSTGKLWFINIAPVL